jgi:hypothetical protein
MPTRVVAAEVAGEAGADFTLRECAAAVCMPDACTPGLDATRDDIMGVRDTRDAHDRHIRSQVARSQVVRVGPSLGVPAGPSPVIPRTVVATTGRVSAMAPRR